MKEFKFIKLPKMGYGSMCLKVMEEFKSHHGIAEEFGLPKDKVPPHVIMEKIMDLLIQTLPQEQRTKLLMEANKYYYDIPPTVR